MYMKYSNYITRTLIWLCVFSTCCIAMQSCSNVDSEIDRAEQIMEQSPADALSIIEGINPDDLSGKHQHARYALIYSETLYHNFIDIESDSLTRPMADYYMSSNIHDERARALYQHALVAQNRGKLAEAMIILEEAEISLTHISNPKLQALIHRTKGDIYANGCLFMNAREAYHTAAKLFDSIGLKYHSASATYDMGGMLIQLRLFDEAEVALNKALDYGISYDNKEFICAVLHELLDLSIYRDDYEDCQQYIDYFSEYDALLYGTSHYYAALAMIHSHNGNTAEALAILNEAKDMEDSEWADLEYAHYIIYRNSGNAEEALYWQERSKNAQDRLMLEVLEQPVLNIQIDMLRQNLDAEQRERELTHQRNIVIFITIGIIALILSLYILYRFRRKDNEINSYVEMVSELENTLRAIPSEMAATVSSLYRDRFSELNELCDIYYDHGGSSRNKSMVFNKLTETIEAIKSDKHRLNELEVAVDKYRNGLMSRLRSEMPRLNERDLRVALYLLAGFSNRAIAIFIDSDPVTVSKLRYNIKQKIKNANLPSSEELLAALSDK